MTMTNVNVSLPETLKKYIEEQVASGDYGTTSEYLRELIREDKKRKAQAKLEALLIEGLESGDAIPVTPEFWKDLWKRVDSRRESRLFSTSPPGGDIEIVRVLHGAQDVDQILASEPPKSNDTRLPACRRGDCV